MKVIAKLNHEIDDLDKELERLHTNEGAERNVKRKESQRLGKSLNRSDAAIPLDGAQQRTGRSPTGNLVASSFTGFADIRKGNTYSNASQEPWVQEAQYYCYAVAIGSGAIIVVWVAAPAVIAGGKAQGLRILSLGNLQEQSLEVVVVPPGLLPFAGDAAF